MTANATKQTKSKHDFLLAKKTGKTTAIKNGFGALKELNLNLTNIRKKAWR